MMNFNQGDTETYCNKTTGAQSSETDMLDLLNNLPGWIVYGTYIDATTKEFVENKLIPAVLKAMWKQVVNESNVYCALSTITGSLRGLYLTLCKERIRRYTDKDGNNEVYLIGESKVESQGVSHTILTLDENSPEGHYLTRIHIPHNGKVIVEHFADVLKSKEKPKLSTKEQIAADLDKEKQSWQTIMKS